MFKKSLLAAAVFMAVSGQASALVLVEDWKLVTGSTTYQNITQISLDQLQASTVNQEVDASGNVFVGAKFNEMSTVFSTRYTDAATSGFTHGVQIWFFL